MKCPKCGSENCSVQVVTETEVKEKKTRYYLVDLCRLVVGAY